MGNQEDQAATGGVSETHIVLAGLRRASPDLIRFMAGLADRIEARAQKHESAARHSGNEGVTRIIDCAVFAALRETRNAIVEETKKIIEANDNAASE